MRATMWSALACVAVTSAALAQEVKLTVREPVGTQRKAEPISTGVCFKPGQVRDLGQLALFTPDGQPVPAQFLPLVKLEDGSFQWTLVDFQADVPAGGQVEVVVKPGKPTAPLTPVQVTESAGVFTFNTGPLQLVVDSTKPVFDLVSQVTVDGRPAATGLGADAMTCRDALDRNHLYHAGKPTKVEFDWRGPMRATLMLEGPYVDDAGADWLGYRVRVSCFAGSRLVRVEHELRNSSPKEVRVVKVKDAFLRLGLADDAPAAATGKDHLTSAGVFAKHRLLSGYFSPGLHDLAVKDKRLTLAVVPTYEGGFEPNLHRGYNNQEKDKNGQPADYNPGDTGSWWLVDCAYKVDEYWLRFGGASAGLSAEAAATLAKALDSRCYALASPAYYSDCEALGFGHFGSLEDEVATYAKWGWKDIEARKAALLKNEWMRPRPEYHVASDLAHEETETDDAEGCLLMALRTGGRGYWDAGLAWARYYTNNFIWRTDFPAGTPRGKGKTLNYIGKDYEPIVRYGYSYGNGRTCGCHFYGGGAMDYYVLTGEKSLLLGCADLVEYPQNNWARKVPGRDAVGSYGSRGFGRQFLAVIRYYEITREPQAKQLMNHMAQLALKEPNYIQEEDYGFIDAPSSNAAHGRQQVTAAIARLPRLQQYLTDKGLKWDEASCTMTDKSGAKWKVYDAAGSWEQTYVQQAMERYHRLTGDTAAADYLVRFANFFRRFAWDDHCQQVCYIAWGVHVPEQGMCLGAQTGRWDPKHDTCPGPGATHSGWYTCFGPDVACRAYLVTKDKKYLEQAKSYWNRGSKWGYQVQKPSAPDDAVGDFAYHVPPKNDSILATALMFYLVPRSGL
jgi:hypothetical protein